MTSTRGVAVQTRSATDQANTGFPLGTAADGRFLVDGTGRPFLVQGDAAWCLITQLKRNEIDEYLSIRKRQGFNTILVQLIEPHFSAHAPANMYGQVPFQTPGDFSTPNDAYFSYAEYAVSRAAAFGMLVLLSPAYLGYGGGEEGWYADMRRSGVDKLRRYGAYVARRFQRFDNILWVEGGDYDPPEEDLVRAVADGIYEVDQKWPHTFHGKRHTDGFAFFRSAPSWLSVNSVYSDENTVVPQALKEFARSSAPYILIESRYEGDGGTGALTVRQQAYQALLSGATGHVYGNHAIWPFIGGWRDLVGLGWRRAMNSKGAQSMQTLKRLFDSLSWWRLRPDSSGAFLAGDVGVGRDRAVAAVAVDGAFAVAYTPAHRSLQIRAGGSVPFRQVRWFDPVSGEYRKVDVPGGLESARRWIFTPPLRNAAGDPDWLLILER